MDGRGGYPPMQHPYWEHAGNGHPFLWLLFFLILASLVGIVAAFVLHRFPGRRQVAALPFAPAAASVAGDALSVVRMRYARGEIDREQFLQATADLSGSGGYPVAEPPLDAPTA